MFLSGWTLNGLLVSKVLLNADATFNFGAGSNENCYADVRTGRGGAFKFVWIFARSECRPVQWSTDASRPLVKSNGLTEFIYRLKLATFKSSPSTSRVMTAFLSVHDSFWIILLGPSSVNRCCSQTGKNVNIFHRQNLTLDCQKPWLCVRRVLRARTRRPTWTWDSTSAVHGTSTSSPLRRRRTRWRELWFQPMRAELLPHLWSSQSSPTV